MAAPSVQGCGWESSLYDSGWGVWTKVAEGSWVCARAFFGAKFSDGRVAGGAREGLSWVAPRDCRRRHTCAARQCWPRRVATVRRSRRFYCVSRGESGTSARASAHSPAILRRSAFYQPNISLAPLVFVFVRPPAALTPIATSGKPPSGQPARVKPTHLRRRELKAYITPALCTGRVRLSLPSSSSF